jgi:hypothetical protein
MKCGHCFSEVDSTNEAVSVHENLQLLRIDDRFLSQNLCIVFDAFSPISPTRIGEIKILSMILIQLRLPMFALSSLHIQLLKKEVIPPTRLRRARMIGRFGTCSPNFSGRLMRITGILPGDCLRHHAVHICKEIFSITFISKNYISLQAPSQIFVDRLARLG